MKARREVLWSIGKRADTHAGLWMDKFLTDQTTQNSDRDDTAKHAKGNLLAEVASIPLPDLYPSAYLRRQRALESSGRYVVTARARALGRAVIGLGQKGPTEVGISLEHSWGVPILPGSALKGVAAAAAHQLHGGTEWEKAKSADGKVVVREANSYDWLFGTTDERGAVSFLDAWLDPNCATPSGKPLDLDVMTVHHPKYYAGETNPDGRIYPPSDMDSPSPNSFLTTSGNFLVVIEGEAAWAEAAFRLLNEGLEHLGIGAKTNSGYGRFALERQLTAEPALRQQEAERLRAHEETLKKRWAALDVLPRQFLGINNATDVFARLLAAYQEECPETKLREVAAALAADKDKRATWRRWGKGEKRNEAQRTLFAKIFEPLLG